MADHNLNFSWSDTLRATLSPCLACLGPNSASTDSLLNFDHNITNDNSVIHPSRGRIPRARTDELHGLLNDPITDDDNDSSRDGDTMSLHSNIGDPDRNRRRKKKSGRGRRKKQANAAHGAKSITFFGFDLFGRKPAIQLTENESDDEDPIHRSLLGPPSAGNPTSAQSHHLTSDSQSDTTGGLGRRDSWGASTTLLTFDSDASLLDPSVIDSMTPEELAAHVHAAEEERLAREERRRRRREKKEQTKKRLEMERRMEMDLDDELLKASGNQSPAPRDAFEGFQGSTEGGPLRYTPEEYGKFALPVNEFGDASTTSVSSGSSSITRLSKPTSRRPSPLSFPHPPPAGANPDDEVAVDADFDGNLYNIPSLKPPTPSGSDSKSRTSGSASQRSLSYSQPPPTVGHDSLVPSGTATPRTKPKKKKSTTVVDPPPLSAPPDQTRHRATQSRSSALSATLPLSPPPSAPPHIPVIAEASSEYGSERRLEAPPASEQELTHGKVSGFEGYPIGDSTSDAVPTDFPITGFGRSGSNFGAGFGSRAFRASDGSSSDHSGQGPTKNQRADVGIAAMLARRGEF